MPESAGQRMERKFWIALVLYGSLAVLAWYTLGDGTVRLFGGPVPIRLVVALVLGTFAFRMMMARWAEKIRRSNGEDAGKLL